MIVVLYLDVARVNLGSEGRGGDDKVMTKWRGLKAKKIKKSPEIFLYCFGLVCGHSSTRTHEGNNFQ